MRRAHLRPPHRIARPSPERAAPGSSRAPRASGEDLRARDLPWQAGVVPGQQVRRPLLQQRRPGPPRGAWCAPRGSWAERAAPPAPGRYLRAPLGGMPGGLAAWDQLHLVRLDASDGDPPRRQDCTAGHPGAARGRAGDGLQPARLSPGGHRVQGGGDRANRADRLGGAGRRPCCHQRVGTPGQAGRRRLEAGPRVDTQGGRLPAPLGGGCQIRTSLPQPPAPAPARDAR
jgi:hypothetical protein